MATLQQQSFYLMQEDLMLKKVLIVWMASSFLDL